ncbi:nuclear egress lamina protein [Vespertilionid gammaherpesvirus 1]|uniref:Nuclear egress lamina protein n=1 Tax=Vespertilionid gammaherpesvirus 1 TaxID=2560830 RepID=A0A0X9XSP5_9GAMA|nr:nuclear egress lamina protein [Myotis gammaherpesvirus 8]AMA67427.1 nuclear egress lamina protein [Vespertilionid gammaherpesvirus 1]
MGVSGEQNEQSQDFYFQRPLSPDRKSIHSKKSKKSHKSYNSRKHKQHPYKKSSSKHNSDVKDPLSSSIFFAGISKNSELGKDFLREMDTPICTSKIIFLPLEIDQVAPGRCLVLSPFGHVSNMGFHCDCCSDQASKTHKWQHNGNTMKKLNADELYSVSVSFFNNAEKVVQNKNFYLSLLSHSMNTVKQSFLQPGLLYGYLVLRNLCEEMFPVFLEKENSLIMFTIFNHENLHIGEICLRLLTDNLPEYKITIDCIKQSYVIKFDPISVESKGASNSETAICEAISALDYTDEIKQEILNGQQLVAGF